MIFEDKDKLYIIASLYIKDVNKVKGMQMMNNVREYLRSNVDDSVKVFVFPVLVPELQKLEIINPSLMNIDNIKNLNSKYEDFLKDIDDFINK